MPCPICAHCSNDQLDLRERVDACTSSCSVFTCSPCSGLRCCVAGFFHCPLSLFTCITSDVRAKRPARTTDATKKPRINRNKIRIKWLLRYNFLPSIVRSDVEVRLTRYVELMVCTYTTGCVCVCASERPGTTAFRISCHKNDVVPFYEIVTLDIGPFSIPSRPIAFYTIRMQTETHIVSLSRALCTRAPLYVVQLIRRSTE